MPDWRQAVDRRLAEIGIPPTRRIDILEEVQAYLEDRCAELRNAGHDAGEARRLALADLETETFARELVRIEARAAVDLPPLGSGRSTSVTTLWQDVRYAARSIARTPGFSLVVIVTLALGIGANAAIFSVADAVMLRPYAYPDMERIVVLSERTREGQPMSVAWPTFQDWRAQNQVFEHLGVYRASVVNITGGDRAERLNASVTSSEVFAAVGIQPSLGRGFAPADDLPGTALTALISERLWRSRFNADPQIVGRTILLNNEPHTILGVMPPAMRFPSRLTDVWLPFGTVVPTLPNSRGAHPGLSAVGKLKREVTFERAVADMDTIAQRLAAQYPESNRNVLVDMNLYYEQIVSGIRPTLFALLGAVSFVLLIACANLANLMLARAERRQREIAVRTALGASRRRIVQQLLTESLALAAVGGALGIALAYWLVNLFVASRPVTVPRIDLVAVDTRVVVYAAIISVVTGALFGLVPALRASRTDLRSTLTEAGRGSVSAPARRLRSILVVTQVAMALMLLVGAGLMIRSFARLMSIDPGFDPANVVTMRLTLPPAKYPDLQPWQGLHEDFVQRVAKLPGVEAAAVNSGVPLEGGGSESGVMVEGRPTPEGSPNPMCMFQTGTPDYFRAMGIPLLKGRFFDARDRTGAPLVAIVDETLVRSLFPGEDPIGKRLSFEATGDAAKSVRIWREIVGVVGHVRHYSLAGGPSYVQIHTPFAQLPVWFERRRPTMALLTRTAIPADSLIPSIREQLASLDPDVPVYNVQTLERYLTQHTESSRLNVFVLGGLGALALILAAVGIYGVVSYSVAQRTQEIGVRVALGATRRDVLKLVVGQAVTMVLVGVMAGVCGSLALGSVLRSLVFQVSERDAATLAVVAAGLTLVGIIASLLPALRATRVDPVEAMREA